MRLHTKHQSSRPSEKKIFSRFPYISLCKICECLAGPILTTNQISGLSWPYDFRQDGFKCFSLYEPMLNM